MPAALIAHFQRMAAYNQGANQRLYAACAELPEAELKRRRQAFFSSIHGTLNHILLGDRIWLTRFEGGTAPSTNLDAILYEDFAGLRAAREAEDARILRFTETLSPEFFTRTLVYGNNQGLRKSDPADVILAHFFNHQTHHRGQVHDMLSQTEVPPPSLDLHRVLRP
jgi:uncharacterized damage-inducible protein DinB